MSDQNILDRARIYLWSNARLLERQRFSYLFEGGARQPVQRALHAYLNDDGGFGNALEPDKRCSESQPVDQEVAFGMLDEIGWDQDLARRVCDFLLTISTDEGGVPFVLPTVASAPRAPWWNTANNPPAAINPTASLAGYLHKHHVQHPWLDQATAFSWRKIERMPAEEPHDLLCAFRFLEHVPDRARAEQQFRRLADGLMKSGLVAMDPNATGYVFGPLVWASTPHSPCRGLFNDEVIAAHLDALTARQQQDGSWSLTWPAVSPGCELEYRGVMTIDALKTLKAYGRLM
ncbi:MAG: hypothetical protein M1546_03180 [Chloroflexi bacterium]|nr:hypothetical protein [Chloroflexota bacterium]